MALYFTAQHRTVPYRFALVMYCVLFSCSGLQHCCPAAHCRTVFTVLLIAPVQAEALS
jgi:hypothetical protein